MSLWPCIEKIIEWISDTLESRKEIDDKFLDEDIED